MTDLIPVHCRGCRNVTAWARDEYHKVFCAPWCAQEPPASSNEERDDLIVNLYIVGRDIGRLGELFGMTRQRAGQIIKERTAA